jgi:hypothetical protein
VLSLNRLITPQVTRRAANILGCSNFLCAYWMRLRSAMQRASVSDRSDDAYDLLAQRLLRQESNALLQITFTECNSEPSGAVCGPQTNAIGAQTSSHLNPPTFSDARRRWISARLFGAPEISAAGHRGDGEILAICHIRSLFWLKATTSSCSPLYRVEFVPPPSYASCSKQIARNHPHFLALEIRSIFRTVIRCA